MLILVWIAICLTTTVLSQQTHTKIQQNGANFEWGWHLNPAEGGAHGHYTTYVNLIPQISNTAINQDVSNKDQKDAIAQAGSSQQPLEIFVLPTQDPSANQNVQILQAPLPTEVFQYTSVPNVMIKNPQTSQYFIHHEIGSLDKVENKDKQTNENVYSTPLPLEENVENESKTISPVVKVFKDHNCPNNDDVPSENVSNDYFSNSKKAVEPTAESQVYKSRSINGHYGLRQSEKSINYKGSVNFKVDPPKDRMNGRYYYNNEEVQSTTQKSDYLTNEQLARLVASTQDLITNEDLLRINHAVEKSEGPITEDIIKPKPSKPRFTLQAEQTRHGYDHPSTPRSIITIKTKIGNIVDSTIDHLENKDTKEKVLQTNAKEYTFASPIIVPDSNYNNFKGQIVNNIISTMVPYIENGYQLVDVRNSFEGSESSKDQNSGEILVTPRPISSNYLAPITVALRLLNSNNTDIFNTVDDHVAADSEIIDSVDKPKYERTVVEVQESIPVEITHINDVEVHEYLNEGRSNDRNPLEAAKNYYNRYMEAKRKFRLNMNDLIEKYASTNYYNIDSKEENNESGENLEPSENIQSEVEVRPNQDHNKRKEYIRNNFKDLNDGQKIIQPIVVEKEIPVTKYVDRYIEKPVPYPDPFEVVKEVPVDRPVAIPVPYEKIVEKPVEVTKYVDKPYPVALKVPQPYPVEIKVPYPVEQKVYIDRPIHVPFPIDRIIEKQIMHHYPVPTPVAVPVEVQVPVEQQVLYPVPIEKHIPYPVEVPKPVEVEKIIQKEIRVPYPVEKKVPYPVHYETKVPIPYPVEKRIPVPVEKIVEKPVTVTKYIDRPVRVEVPVPHPVPVAVHIPQPYPVDRVVEKKVPYPVPVDRIVEKKVHVKVPFPVEKLVEKIVQKPVIVTQYVDKPYPVEKRVPYPVDRIVERKVPYPVQVPVEVKVPYPVEKVVERPVHVPIRVPYYTEMNYSKSNNEKTRELYNYGYGFDIQLASSIRVPNYQKFEQQKLDNTSKQSQMAQYYQSLKERQQKSDPVILSTHWGNLYASSYQYINNTGPKQQNQSLKNYLNFLTNDQNNSQYYGPILVNNSKNIWEVNNDKVRRTDRMPRVTHLRIEYGFKPPLVPSTEIDLNGVPVKKENES